MTGVQTCALPICMPPIFIFPSSTSQNLAISFSIVDFPPPLEPTIAVREFLLNEQEMPSRSGLNLESCGTAEERAFVLYGLEGPRGEAERGFPMTLRAPSKRFVKRPKNKLPFPIIIVFLSFPAIISRRACPIKGTPDGICP